MIDWHAIQTVLLDMDGTLLDLHFDNYFWQEHVPRRYGEKYGMSVDQAKDELYPHFRRIEGTIDWYSVDYWTHQLGLDIAMLKEEVDHLIAIHPYVVGFLDAVRRSGKRAVLVTNAHNKSLALKLDRTRLGGHLDRIVCAHDLGVPKEQRAFWERLHDAEPYHPASSLLVDDNVRALRSARDYGVRYLLGVSQPDTREPAREFGEFPAIRYFNEIMPVE